MTGAFESKADHTEVRLRQSAYPTTKWVVAIRKARAWSRLFRLVEAAIPLPGAVHTFGIPASIVSNQLESNRLGDVKYFFANHFVR